MSGDDEQKEVLRPDRFAGDPLLHKETAWIKQLAR